MKTSEQLLADLHGYLDHHGHPHRAIFITETDSFIRLEVTVLYENLSIGMAEDVRDAVVKYCADYGPFDHTKIHTNREGFDTIYITRYKD